MSRRNGLKRYSTIMPSDLRAPKGAVIGVTGAHGSGITTLLREAAAGGRYCGPPDTLDLSPAPVIALDHRLARLDALERCEARLAIRALARQGTTFYIASHERELLFELADELWWMDAHKVMRRGDPREVWTAYQQAVVRRLREWAEAQPAAPPVPALRRGDGRAEIEELSIAGENGRATAVVRSGEMCVIRVAVHYREAVDDPVIGVMIRTRIGLDVYGTNTELENVRFGPVQAGETVQLDFGFRCELCPTEYTITAASHDPDGTAHDWMDDAVAFTVAAARYTAGVADLHASVNVRRGAVR